MSRTTVVIQAPLGHVFLNTSNLYLMTTNGAQMVEASWSPSQAWATLSEWDVAYAVQGFLQAPRSFRRPISVAMQLSSGAKRIPVGQSVGGGLVHRSAVGTAFHFASPPQTQQSRSYGVQDLLQVPYLKLWTGFDPYQEIFSCFPDPQNSYLNCATFIAVLDPPEDYHGKKVDKKSKDEKHQEAPC